MHPHALLQTKVPLWLVEAGAGTRQALRSTFGSSLPWLEAARQHNPECVASLLDEYALHRFDQQQVDPVLAQLPSAEAFAEPLLRAALKERFARDINVRTSYLFHARQAKLDQSFEAASQDPLVMLQQALKTATMSLLKAALQNFEAGEAEPGGMDHDTGSKAAIYSAYPLDGVFIAGPVIDIAPHAFAALCRELDLGGQYKRLVERTFNPVSLPGVAPDAAAVNLATTFKLLEQSAFRVQVHLAFLQQAIGRSAYEALLEVPRQPTVTVEGKPLGYSLLRLWDVELTGIVVFSPDREESQRVEKITVYIPDDPISPLKEYASTAAFMASLRDALLTPGYLKFFERFVPARQRDALFRRIHATLYPKVWVSNPGWYQEQADRNARLQLAERPFSQGFLTQLYQQKVDVLKDDGVFHAVPTATQDQKTRDQKLSYFAGKVFDALNIAAFVVPGLGEVMLTVTAVQLGYEAFEGLESLAEGDRQAAFGYLMDVVDNLALMAALGAAGSVGGRQPAVEVPGVVSEMRAVQRPDGSAALWKPDLTPFAHDIVLPAGLKPDSLGLYAYQGKQWLALDGRTYAVKGAGDNAPYRMQHPSRPDAYAPTLRHNGAGAWVSEAEQPLDWQGLSLLRRLQPDSAGLSDEAARQVLCVSDTREAVLRRALAEGERPPALLEDTLQRFRLDQALDGTDTSTGQQRRERFAADYAALDTTTSSDVHLLQRTFVGLPTKLAEELLSHATVAEREQLGSTRRLPTRLAEEARAYQQQVRLARAREGLYLDTVHNADSDRLVLQAVERLPGWTATVRIEMRDLTFHGALIDSIGPVDARELKVLIRDGDAYLARDAQGLHLHGRDDIYGALMHSLPDAERAALGVSHVGQTTQLKRAIRGLPIPTPPTLRERLHMQPLAPSAKSPMRLADGRLGYPLSGRGALGAYFTEDTLLDKIRLLEFEDAYPEQILQDFYAAGLTRSEINTHLDRLFDEQAALRNRLDNWAMESAAIIDLTPARSRSRERTGQALWAHWRANSLLGVRGTAMPLRLDWMLLSDFPEALPGFMYERTQTLVLSDVAVDTPLDPFFARFTHVTALEVSRTGTTSAFLPVNLLQLIVARFARLTALSVNGLILPVEQVGIELLRGLGSLRRLDLSGNWLYGNLDFSGFNLDYLGLERLNGIGSTQWPSWLSSATLDAVAEVSLANNRIVELPEFILQNPPASRQTRISLQGNVLPRATLIDLRLNEGVSNRFSFDLDVPEVLQSNLNVLVQEHATLTQSIEDWLQASGSSATLSEERLAARRRLGDGILNFWGLRSRQGGAAVLHLEDVTLAEFPRTLPGFFYERVVRLHVTRPRATAVELDQFLGRFVHVADLVIAGHVTPMAELPSALHRMNALESLSLMDQDLLIDQAAITFFSTMPALDQLVLDGNRLGTITTGNGLGGERLHLLSLNEVGLETWPEWLSTMLPHAVEVLALEDNHLTELPAFILQNARVEHFRCEINLRGNPLNYETMYQAHVSESYNRPYAFSMDLPDDILALSQSEPHSSDTPGSGTTTTQHTHSPGMTPEAPPASVEPWVVDALDQEASRREAWQQIEDSNEAEHLLNLIARLQHTADYRTLRTRPGLVDRVWQVLQAAGQDTELRLMLNAMAEEPLQQIVQHATCPDGIRLEFNQMEVLVYTRRALRDVPQAQRAAALYRLMRRLYRLHQLDSIAVEQAGMRDQAEVRLMYRLRWAQTLDLPLPPGSMLYEASADIRPGELDRALLQVQQGEQGLPLLEYAAQRDFWVEYLRETHGDRFSSLKQAYEARVLEVTELYPDDTPDQTSARITALERGFVADERNLIDELTNRAGVDYA